MNFSDYMHPPIIDENKFPHRYEITSLKEVNNISQRYGLRWKKYNNLWVSYKDNEIIASYRNYNLLSTSFEVE